MLSANRSHCVIDEPVPGSSVPLSGFIDPQGGNPRLFYTVVEDLFLNASLQKLPQELDALTKKKAILAKALLSKPEKPVSFFLGNELSGGEKLVFCGLLQQACRKYELYATVYYAKENAGADRLEECA